MNMKLTKNLIQPIAGAMLCIFCFPVEGKMLRQVEWLVSMP